MGVLEVSEGDILTCQADMLVNPVNTVGVMGKGLAARFRKAFPMNCQLYQEACASGAVRPGRVFVTHPGPSPPRLIANFPTKRHWKDGSRIEDIEAGMADLRRVVELVRASSVAIPALGCGLGGLFWSDVRQLVTGAMSDLPGTVVLLFNPSCGTSDGETWVETQGRGEAPPARAN